MSFDRRLLGDLNNMLEFPFRQLLTYVEASSGPLVKQYAGFHYLESMAEVAAAAQYSC